MSRKNSTAADMSAVEEGNTKSRDIRLNAQASGYVPVAAIIRRAAGEKGIANMGTGSQAYTCSEREKLNVRQ